MACVYQILNIKNNKRYIGSTLQKNIRFNKHKNELRNNNHPNVYLQEDWNKYSEDDFVFKILCDNITEIDKLNQEQNFINSFDFNTLYNIQPNSNLSMRGAKFTERHKNRLRKAMRGKTPARSTIQACIKKNTINIDESIKQNIIVLYEKGVSLSQLSKDFKYSIKKIRKELILNNVLIDSTKRRNQTGSKNSMFKYICNETQLGIIQMFKNSIPLRQIQNKYNLSYKLVKRVLSNREGMEIEV